MKILFILLTLISTLSFADTIQVQPSEAIVESILENETTVSTDPDCLLAYQRSMPSCSWSECVDDCNAERIDCLQNNSSSTCGPRYDRCKKNRCKNCN